MAEIRLDGVELTEEETRRIFALHKNLIATCRPTSSRTEADREKMLLTAIDAGAAWVDVEIDADRDFKKEIAAAARAGKCRLILSYHNYDAVPSKKELESIMDRCFAEGAGVAKIACRVHTEPESARILSLYSRPLPTGTDVTGKPYRLVALGMGEKGKITRIAAPLLGAPFTFASVPGDPATAPGQLDRVILEQVYRLVEQS
jgi:3-dehydroquinate dehydratase-1